MTVEFPAQETDAVDQFPRLAVQTPKGFAAQESNSDGNSDHPRPIPAPPLAEVGRVERPVLTRETAAERRLWDVIEKWAWIVAGEDSA